MKMNLRIGIYCLLGGLSFSMVTAAAGHFGWWGLSGALLAAAYVPVARFGPKSWAAQLGVILVSSYVVGAVCTGSEAAMFLPGQSVEAWRNVASAFVLYLIAALVLATAAKMLKLREEAGAAPEHRRGVAAGLGVLVSGLAYVVFYLVFGGITFFWFTKRYYPQGQQMAEALGIWLWVIQLGRGVLMTLAVLPAIYTLRMRRWPAAVAIGILLWVVGGLAPLVVPNAMMVPRARAIHIVEILTQNAALGITAVLLLRPARRRAIASELATADTR